MQIILPSFNYVERTRFRLFYLFSPNLTTSASSVDWIIIITTMQAMFS